MGSTIGLRSAFKSCTASPPMHRTRSSMESLGSKLYHRPCATRTDWHLQSVVLRRGVGGPCPPGPSGTTTSSRSRQKRRFLKRIERKEKNWKFSAADIRERQYWDDYMEAYEEMFNQTLGNASSTDREPPRNWSPKQRSADAMSSSWLAEHLWT
jgi:hypothetical protein